MAANFYFIPDNKQLFVGRAFGTDCGKALAMVPAPDRTCA
jgi:hypothetical protein